MSDSIKKLISLNILQIIYFIQTINLTPKIKCVKINLGIVKNANEIPKNRSRSL